MTTFYSGVAGARGYAPRGVVIHNDAGSVYANAAYYRSWLPTHTAENGFAHYYVAADGTFQAENEANVAWHTANSDGNYNYIGIEACQSMGPEATFRQNEENSIKLAAQVLKRYGLPANRTTVKLHKQFSSTACPHRSVSLHGDYTVMQDYFISRINSYMGSSTPAQAPIPNPGGNTNNQNTKKGVATMYAIYWVPNKNGKNEDAYFFNGVSYEHIEHPDVLKILKDVYKDNNGKNMPEYHWKSNAPWWLRLEQPIVNLQAMSDKIDKIDKKIK